VHLGDLYLYDVRRGLESTAAGENHATIAKFKMSTQTPVAVTAKRRWTNRVVRLLLFMGAFPSLVQRSIRCAVCGDATNVLSDRLLRKP
jgi:hypothetical protein